MHRGVQQQGILEVSKHTGAQIHDAFPHGQSYSAASFVPRASKKQSAFHYPKKDGLHKLLRVTLQSQLML